MSANSLSSLPPTFWANEAQKSLFVENRAMAIANTTLRNLVAGEGNTVRRVTLSYPASATYVPGTDITQTPLSSGSEDLTIGTWLASLVRIDDTEMVQSVIALGSNVMKKMMMDHKNRIEQAVLAEAANAQWSLDDGNVGGTSGNRAVINTNNVEQLFTASDTKLDAIDAPRAGRTAVIGTHVLNQLKLTVAGRNTQFGDGVLTRGVVANIFGWDILYSNNLPYYVVLTLDTNPTDGDTMTIAGVTFTFRTTQGALAGSINICSDAAHTLDSIVATLNALDTTVAEATDAGYNAISGENVFLLRDKRRIVAAELTSTTLSISGYGDIVVSETFTAGTNVFSGHKQTSLFCVRGCVDIIVQIPPKVETTRAPLGFADIVKSLLGFGKKTYADGAREMVQVSIDASTSDWT